VDSFEFLLSGTKGNAPEVRSFGFFMILGNKCLNLFARTFGARLVLVYFWARGNNRILSSSAWLFWSWAFTFVRTLKTVKLQGRLNPRNRKESKTSCIFLGISQRKCVIYFFAALSSFAWLLYALGLEIPRKIPEIDCISFAKLKRFKFRERYAVNKQAENFMYLF